MKVTFNKKANEAASTKSTILRALRRALRPFGDFKIDDDIKDQYDEGSISVDILDYDGLPAEWVSEDMAEKDADDLCEEILAALEDGLEEFGCEVSSDGEGDMVYAYIEVPDADESKKAEKIYDFGLDYSEVKEDAAKFRFAGLLQRLDKFEKWYNALKAKAPKTVAPLVVSVDGDLTTGINYEISSYHEDPVQFSFKCGTNPDLFPLFKGSIKVGSKEFKIDSVDDLTDKLIEDIAKAL